MNKHTHLLLLLYITYPYNSHHSCRGHSLVFIQCKWFVFRCVRVPLQRCKCECVSRATGSCQLSPLSGWRPLHSAPSCPPSPHGPAWPPSGAPSATHAYKRSSCQSPDCCQSITLVMYSSCSAHLGLIRACGPTVSATTFTQVITELTFQTL